AVTVGDVAATVQGSFLQPGQVGVYQVNIVIPAGLANGNQPVVLTVSGAASNTVTLPLGQPAADPAPSIAAAVSATGIPGSVQFNIQSGSWVSIYGSSLSDVTTDWTGQIVNGVLPTSLAGVSVSINGRAAFVYYVSPTQVNVQAPEAPPGPVQVVLTRRGVLSAPATAQLREHAPAFFHWGPAKYALTTRHPDNTYIGHPDLGAVFVAARPGNVLILWGTGFGPTVPQVPAGVVVSGAPVTATLPTVTVGGLPATVIGAALSPGLAGVYQVAIQLPDNVPAGDVEVRATIGGQQSPENVYLYVRRD
ncbi:MAG: IPT/TIG domain-containing protein, partial [Candidatus Hydrogenedentes bacterium]|nr:IPT/TIG domain-containing protein [Candidatus Hydrogenedentota bacterium]